MVSNFRIFLNSKAIYKKISKTCLLEEIVNLFLKLFVENTTTESYQNKIEV